MPNPNADFVRPLRVWQRASLAVSAMTASILAGCASIKSTDATTSGGNLRTYEVAITREVVLPGPPERVFAFITAEDVLPKVLTGYGPLPAVVGTSANTGPWDTPGSARIVHLADESTAREQVTQYAAPEAFAYRVWDFTHPVIRALATQGRGTWAFTPTAGGTQVVWTYTFTARNAAAALPLSGIARLLWRGYMDVCLENAKRLLDPAVLPVER